MSRDAFPILETRLTPSSPRFQENEALNKNALEELAEAFRAARGGAKEEHVRRHRERGRLLPYERLELLLDPGSWFVELCPLAGHRVKGEFTGTTIRGGVGLVSGAPCLIFLNESTLRGGAVSELSVQKTNRLAEVAEENNLITISLIESGGADLANQSKIFLPGGQAFRDLTRRSAAGIPSICVVFGSSTAGGAYIPGMSDYTVLVQNQAQVYLAGPPLVKMATGEETDHESLGGAKMHAEVSGLADYLVANEPDGIETARRLVAQLTGPRPAGAAARRYQGLWTHPPLGTYPEKVEPPRFSPEELLGIAPTDLRAPVDPREVIARMVDGSRFMEFKKRYGPTLVTGWAELFGIPLGILANRGVLVSEAAEKGAQFIQLCNQSQTPLLFLQNITGFMVGTRAERRGIIKHGAKLINAVSNSAVPTLTLMIGASYGAGNYGMAGRAYRPRFLFSWPNHKIAVMGGRQLAGVMDIVQREALKKKGVEPDEEKLAAGQALIEAKVEEESSALFATAHLWDDGVIDPRDSRSVLGLALQLATRAPYQGSTRWGVFRH